MSLVTLRRVTSLTSPKLKPISATSIFCTKRPYQPCFWKFGQLQFRAVGTFCQLPKTPANRLSPKFCVPLFRKRKETFSASSSLSSLSSLSSSRSRVIVSGMTPETLRRSMLLTLTPLLRKISSSQEPKRKNLIPTLEEISRRSLRDNIVFLPFEFIIGICVLTIWGLMGMIAFGVIMMAISLIYLIWYNIVASLYWLTQEDSSK